MDKGKQFMKTTFDSETAANGQQIISVTAFIHYRFRNSVKVFLPKRASTKKFLPDLWEMPGGHVDFGEDIVEGLKREVKEEFGMEISVGDPFSVFTYINEIKGSHSIEVVYFAKFLDPLEDLTINPEDHSEFKWFGEYEIDQITEKRPENDPEIAAIKKGFAILKGKSLNFE